MTMLKRILILSLFFAAATAAWGDEPKENTEAGIPNIRAIVTPKEATVGDILEYRINIAGKNIKDIKILLPEKKMAFPVKEITEGKTGKGQGKDNQAEAEGPAAAAVPLYIIHNAKKDDRSEKDIMDMTVILEMSYYRPGTHKMPVIDIIDVDKANIGYKVPEINIKSLNEKGQFHDVEPPLELSGNYTRLIILIIGVIIATILGLIAFRYIKKTIEEKKQEVIIIPAIVTFREEIDQFEGKKLIEEKQNRGLRLRHIRDFQKVSLFPTQI
jgi:hypothetical protein